MISGIFHRGSGLGNQLFRYITARTLALDKGFKFGMIAPELFKGSSFMKLDMGKSFDGTYAIEDNTRKVIPLFYEGKRLKQWEEKTFYYNPEINYLEDHTIIDGSFEDSRYWEHRIPEIDKWFKVESLEVPDDVCVIGFRGGEYYSVPELGLPKEYFAEAIVIMLQKNINMKFEVHTDDTELAKQFFPNYKIIHDIGLNWRSMRYAKYAIIANSSFYVLPRLLKPLDVDPQDDSPTRFQQPFGNKVITIAPRYWNRYNTKKWDYPQNYYKQFLQI
jgi:hypothetical protein